MDKRAIAAINYKLVKKARRLFIDGNLLDVSGIGPDVLVHPNEYIKGHPKFTEVDGKTCLKCCKGWIKEIFRIPGDTNHVACILGNRLTDKGMQMLCPAIYDGWMRHLKNKRFRAEMHAKIEQSRLSNPGGQTDRQLHNEVSSYLRAQSSIRCMASEARRYR